MSYLTKNGIEFYDILILIESIQDIPLPKSFSNVLKNMFKKSETFIYTKKYYEKEYDHYKNKPKKQKHFKTILENYPNIKKNYTGLNTTLVDKIKETVYDLYKNKPDFSENIIEMYSLNKKLKTKNLPDNLKKLII